MWRAKLPATCFVRRGKLKEVGKVYMQTVVDTYGSFAFGYLYMGKLPDHAALILHNDVLPFYEKHGLQIEAILTDNGREYCGRLTHHHYEIYLELNGIEHRKTRIATPQTNGFAERFNRTVRKSFRHSLKTETLYQRGRTPEGSGRMAQVLQLPETSSGISQHGKASDRNY